MGDIPDRELLERALRISGQTHRAVEALEQRLLDIPAMVAVVLSQMENRMSKELDDAVSAITSAVDGAVAEMKDIGAQLTQAHNSGDVVSATAAVTQLNALAGKLGDATSAAKTANPDPAPAAQPAATPAAQPAASPAAAQPAATPAAQPATPAAGQA